MVRKKEKIGTVQFICDRLEDSCQYNILRSNENGLLVAEKPEIAENPRNISVFVANFLGPIKEINGAFQRNRSRQVYSAPVFYKDGKTAFVRMVEKNKGWRTDKSLKRYTPQEVNQMLHLRGKEKAVMKLFGKKLTYYQPETERLDESLREFSLENVGLDYSHLKPWDPGYNFATNRTSIDYKLPQETATIEPAGRIHFADNDRLLRARLAPAENLED